MALVLAVSPSTSGLDLWFLDRRRQTSSVVGSILKPLIRRRVITLAEAREIALEVLAQAELERLSAAEEEAQRGIDWEMMR
jgi:hypothetical protein